MKTIKELSIGALSKIHFKYTPIKLKDVETIIEGGLKEGEIPLTIAHDIVEYLGIPRRYNRGVIRDYIEENINH